MSVTDERLFVYGASGHGKVVADILLAGGLTVDGFIDDAPSGPEPRLVLGLPVVGSSAWLYERAREGRVAVALGIGSNRVRARIAAVCRERGVRLVTAVHPSAILSRFATVGEGAVVMAGAAINPGASVGEGAIVNTGVVLEHDVVVGDYGHLSANAATGGAASLGRFSHLGLGGVILPGIRVGDHTVVGAGAVVVRDLPDRVVALGVPARIHRRLSEEETSP